MFEIIEAVGAVVEAMEAIDFFVRLVDGTIGLAERLVRRVFG